MTCEAIREAISAAVDGEEPGVEPRVVDAHLRHCPACRAFAEVAEQTRRLGAVEPAPDMPDLSRRVAKLASVTDRRRAWSTVRALLAVAAIEILVLSIPDLAATDESGAIAHDSRHLGAFTVAYAVALLVVAVRPARARTVLPVAAVLAGALIITALVDLLNGNVPLLGEAAHLPELLSVLLVWALARPGGRRTPRRRFRRPPLRVVEERARRAG